MVKSIRRNWYKLLLNPGVIITLFIFFYLIFLIRGDLVKYFELKAERAFLKESILRVQQQKQDYLNELARLDDLAYIEKLARTRLGLIKKGEVGYKTY